MSEWDPFRRYMREQERRMWDPFYRYEYERDRETWDPFFRYEKEQERMLWDPFYRYERTRVDPLLRFEEKQRKLREDPWYREIYRQEHGLRPDQSADPIYVQGKELGLGTRPQDYFNPEYRVHMDKIKEEEERRDAESGEFMRKFFDPNWLSMEDVNQQLKGMDEKKKNDEPIIVIEEKSGFMSFLKKLFGFL